ncbi:hypothetical protein B0I37DRAFT_4722 [Chaetomium sp. MPI-CAGE-AT-0009]|nr:hypothetical protein B0I37DRAFT_4722 [Chaetomium sp. MPI-CAGE-AT-0009]
MRCQRPRQGASSLGRRATDRPTNPHNIPPIAQSGIRCCQVRISRTDVTYFTRSLYSHCAIYRTPDPTQQAQRAEQTQQPVRRKQSSTAHHSGRMSFFFFFFLCPSLSQTAAAPGPDADQALGFNFGKTRRRSQGLKAPPRGTGDIGHSTDPVEGDISKGRGKQFLHSSAPPARPPSPPPFQPRARQGVKKSGRCVSNIPSPNVTCALCRT